MEKVCNNGYEQYLRSRPSASGDSNKKVKTINFNSASVHPMFRNTGERESEFSRDSLLDKMKNYRPHGTVFEICSKNKSADYMAMKAHRALHKETIVSHHRKLEQRTVSDDTEKPEEKLAESNDAEIKDTFDKIILPKKRKIDDLYKSKAKKQRIMKDENFIPYSAPDAHTESGFAVNSFQREADKVQIDMTGDSEETQRLGRQLKKWDRKKKKMVVVNTDAKSKKIRTESGAWIPATYKSNRYEQWKEKTKIASEEADDDDDDDDDKREKKMNARQPHTHWAKHNRNVQDKARKSEMKSSDQILKARLIAEKKRNRNGRRNKNKKNNKKRRS